MSRVEGHITTESIGRRESVNLMARDALPHATKRIDDRGDAIVGVAQNPAPVLDGPHARHIQVLPGRAGISIPAIVADVDEHLGAKLSEMANLVGEDCLVADEDTVIVPIQSKYLALFTGSEP